MIKINMDEIGRMVDVLDGVNRFGLALATRRTFNDAVRQTQIKARSIIERKMIIRNKHTVRSVQFRPVRGATRLGAMSASVGSTVEYMVDQEFGGTKRKKGKRGVPLATGFASGEGDSAKPRKRVPRPSNRLRKIRLGHGRTKAMTRRQRNFVAVRQAAKSTNKFVYLNTGRSKGIYRVMGGKRKPRIKMVYNLSHQSVRIPRNPWLRPAVAATIPKIPGMFATNLNFQIDRLAKAKRLKR